MRVVAAGMLVLLLGGGCQSDHDALTGRDPGGAGGGASGAGHDGGNAGTDEVARGSAGMAGTTGTVDPPEPAGPRVLTLLHAVVDGGRVWFCFSPVDDGEVGPALGSPLPASGLDYGEIFSTGSLTGLDLVSDSFQPWVIEGDLSELEGLDCRQALDQAASYARAWPPTAEGGAGGVSGDTASSAGAAGIAGMAGAAGAGVELYPPPPLQALPLPVIPAGTLSGERSYLLAARGCMGGGTLHSAEWQEGLCGAGYSPTSPTLAPVLVMLSRVSEADALGVQVVHATSDSRPLEIRSVGPASSQSLARDVAPDAIKPRTADLDHSASEYGDPVADAVLEVLESGTVRHSQTWGSAWMGSDLAALSDGHTLAVVVIGPSLGFLPGSWHHGSNLTIFETTRTVP